MLFVGMPMSTSTVMACTGIRLAAADGSIIYARTMECGANLQSNLLIVPRGQLYIGETSSNSPGLHWTTKHGFVGPNLRGHPYLCDGLNEKGLAVGNFVFTGTAGYQEVERDHVDRALASHQVVVFLLGTCTTVKEAVAALKDVRVGLVGNDAYNALLQLHYAVHDAQGHSAVIEYVAGQLHVHENPLGVITNAPTFDWHMTNLRNYIHLSPVNAPPVVIAGQSLVGFGQGTGMLGLPGDFTPPSRFVRAVAYTQTVLPSETGEDCVWQAFHLLNQFDLPRGAIRAENNGKTAVEFTNWTTAADLKRARYYYHTYQNRVVKMIDLTKLDFGATGIKSISMQAPNVAEDVSSDARPWDGRDAM